jgi:hypothetical protein
MDFDTSLIIYKAQCRNVRALEQAAAQCNRSINQALRSSDENSLYVHTRVLALIYSIWAEVSFSKMIHTPYGLQIDKIEQIKQEHSRNGLERAWKRCVELSLQETKATKSRDFPNKRKRILELVDEYVIRPSLLRNKIAHGNWIIALNRDNTAENEEITSALGKLDAITVNIWFRAYELIERIVEDLIESPQKAHQRDYWIHLTAIEEFLENSKNWSIEEKGKRLKTKASYNVNQ